MPETSDHASAAAAEPTRLDASQDSHLESLYRAAIGPMQADYYLPILTRFEAYGRAGPRWNWAACLVTLNWMLLRGLWLPALAYLAAVAAAVLALATGLALAEPPPAESVQWGLWAALGTLALLVPGFFGNAWLYRVYRLRLDRALAATANLKEACTLLARRSGSRPRLAAIIVANVVLLAGAAIVLWPAQLHKRVWPRVSGDVATVAAPAAGAMPPPAAPAADAAPPAVAAPEPSASAAGMAQPDAAVHTPSSAELAASAAPAGDTPSADQTAPSSTPAAVAETPAAVAETPAGGAAREPVLEAASTVATPPPAPPTVEPQPLGPLAQAAAQQQAMIAAQARKAHLPAAAATTAAPAPPTSAATRAAATASAPAPALEGRYLINVGLFAQPDNALRAHNRLKLAGLPAISEALQTRNGQRTRVRVGPFTTRAQADAAAERIRALQLDAVVIRP